MYGILALRRGRQEEHCNVKVRLGEVVSSQDRLGYTVRLFFKKNDKKGEFRDGGERSRAKAAHITVLSVF